METHRQLQEEENLLSNQNDEKLDLNENTHKNKNQYNRINSNSNENFESILNFLNNPLSTSSKKENNSDFLKKIFQ